MTIKSSKNISGTWNEKVREKKEFFLESKFSIDIRTDAEKCGKETYCHKGSHNRHTPSASRSAMINNDFIASKV